MNTNRAIYLGVFLTRRSQAKLLSAITPEYEQVWADHITLVYRPTEEHFLKFSIGKKVRILVVGVYEDVRCQAVSVRILGAKSYNRHPHITLSTKPNIPPNYSNDLLETTKRKRFKFLLLEGFCDTFPRRIYGL